MDTISHIRPWYDQLSQALHTIYIGSVYSYNNFQQIVVWIAANLILTTNDITESIQWGYAPNTYQGRIQDFKLRGAHLKKLRRAEGGANIFGVFRVKNHDVTPNFFFLPILGWGDAVCAPWIHPWRITCLY
jgi:hypothetical protein